MDSILQLKPPGLAWAVLTVHRCVIYVHIKVRRIGTRTTRARASTIEIAGWTFIDVHHIPIDLRLQFGSNIGNFRGSVR